MKNTIINMRTILTYMAADKSFDGNTRMLTTEISLSDEDAINALDMLADYGYITFETRGGVRYELDNRTVELTSKGRNFAEDIKDNKRWNKVVEVCDKMNCYSLDNVLRILEWLLNREMLAYTK